VKTCPDCNGDGVIEKGTDDEQQCPRCGGSGFVPDDDDDEEVTRTAIWRLNPVKRTTDVRLGSEADIPAARINVRFTLKSRHRRAPSSCPLFANTGLFASRSAPWVSDSRCWV
jgi:RecJ-like exonuclease